MKVFKCIVDDGVNVFKSIVTAKSKKELLTVYGGNGEFVSVQDKTKELFAEHSVDYLKSTLESNHWGELETKLICALLEEHIKKVGISR